MCNIWSYSGLRKIWQVTALHLELFRSPCSSALRSRRGNLLPEANVNSTPAGADAASFVGSDSGNRVSGNISDPVPAAASVASATVGAMSVAAAVNRIRTVWESGVERLGRSNMDRRERSPQRSAGVEGKGCTAGGLSHSDPPHNRTVILLDESKLKSDYGDDSMLKCEREDYEDDQNANGLDDRSAVEFLIGVRVRRRIACACANFSSSLKPVSLNVGANDTGSENLHQKMDMLLLCAHRMSDVAVAMVSLAHKPVHVKIKTDD